MLISYRVIMIAVFTVAMNTFAMSQPQLGRIYGRITIDGGDVLEGRISWGDHEMIWSHTFDASYDFYDHNREAYWRAREYRGDRDRNLEAEFISYFGDIKSIERSGSRALLMMKNGREFEVFDGEVGDDVYVNDKELGEIELGWRDIDMIEFMDEPETYSRYSGENAFPIYGRVFTRSDYRFKGFIMWDNDESLSTHILDGNDGKDDREIPFSRIRTITPDTRRSSKVVLIAGTELTLSGTNDVNDDNSGLIIADPEYGIIGIEWRDLERVEFEHNVPAKRFSDFKPGKPLEGTVTDSAGDEYTGYIRWDDDESVTTDFLNGEVDGFDIKIPFSNIKEIRRRTRRSALVTLKTGVELRLSGSNDVDEDNKGIVILKQLGDQEAVMLSWDEFEKVIFSQ
ncbi:hypothetical protein ACFL6I_08365 [candidate division KSB1 bacterium]